MPPTRRGRPCFANPPLGPLDPLGGIHHRLTKGEFIDAWTFYRSRRRAGAAGRLQPLARTTARRAGRARRHQRRDHGRISPRPPATCFSPMIKPIFPLRARDVAAPVEWLRRYRMSRSRSRATAMSAAPAIQSGAGRASCAGRRVLVAHGISAARVSTIQYGKERPGSAFRRSSYAQNRRGVTTVN